MKKALFNLCIGGARPHYQACLKSQHDYCQRFGIDHYIAQEPKIHWPHGPHPTANFFFEKLQVRSLFADGYDQVLYLDADVLVTPDAHNIFEKYPDPAMYYGWDESMEIGQIGETMYGGSADVMDRDPYVTRVIDDLDDELPEKWGKNERDKYIYYNMGVMLMGRDSIDWMTDEGKLMSVQNYPNIYDFNDQTYFNALIQKYSPNKSIDYSFNRINLGERDEKLERYKADFIHYAGPCLYGIEGEFSEQGKVQAILEDHRQLYGG